MNKCPNCGTTSEETKCATCNVDTVKVEEAAAEPVETQEATEVSSEQEGDAKEGDIAV